MTPPKEIIRIGQIELRFLLDGDDTAGRMVVFEFTVPPAARVPAPHYHEHVDEMVYGLDSELTFTVDGMPHRIGIRDRCFRPPWRRARRHQRRRPPRSRAGGA